MTKLTRTIVQSLPLPERGDRFYPDAELPNFGVRVTSRGSRTYYVRLRILGGRRAQQRRIKLGCSETTSPETARRIARDYLAKARLGFDPGTERSGRKNAPSVSQLIDEWLEGAGRRNRRGHIRKDRDWLYDKGRLENHVKPVLGMVKLPDLTRRDIERLRDCIASGNTCRTAKTKPRGKARIRGGEGAATRTLRSFRSVLRYAVEHGYIERNPCDGVVTTPDRCMNRFLSLDEIARLEAVLSRSSENANGLTIIRLLLLTGCRRGEIAALKWSQVDIDDRILRLGMVKGVQRHVFLGDSAADILSNIPKLVGSDWVFPAAHGIGHYQGVGKVWDSVRKEAGLDGVRLHDLRHTYASQSLAAGIPLEVIGAMLGHRELKTTQRYAHLSAGSIRAAVERTATRLAGAMPTST